MVDFQFQIAGLNLALDEENKTLQHYLARDYPIGDCFKPLKVIGKGSYSSVLLARHRPTNELVAVKKIEGVFLSQYEAKHILREMCFLKILSDHPNIIKLKDVIEPTGDLEHFSDVFYVFDWMPSDLLKLMQINISLSEEHIRQIVY